MSSVILNQFSCHFVFEKLPIALSLDENVYIYLVVLEMKISHLLKFKWPAQRRRQRLYDKFCSNSTGDRLLNVEIIIRIFGLSEEFRRSTFRFFVW